MLDKVTVRELAAKYAEEICKVILADRNESFEPSDDISLIVIKYG